MRATPLETLKSTIAFPDQYERKGGKLVAKGTPEDVAQTKGSFTGEYLAPYLEKRPEKKRA